MPLYGTTYFIIRLQFLKFILCQLDVFFMYLYVSVRNKYAIFLKCWQFIFDTQGTRHMI